MTRRLQGKVAIVTGGSRGQGASHVRAFIKEGANVAITDVRADLGQELAKELGENALFIQHDVPRDSTLSRAGSRGRSVSFDE
jgi:3alpha(or 20beta)-hydroxysteroid dehydrogenase